ncbi:MAG: hypothetical protein AAGE52_40960 [Myxococcota bacterium]
MTKTPTPVGEIIAWSSDAGVCVLGWIDARRKLELILKKRFGHYSEGGEDRALRCALENYLEGDASAFDSVRVDARGTPFQE